MSLSEELQKLADLYDNGVLTEQEFAEAKRQLLHPPPKVPAQPSSDLSLGSAVQNYISFQMVMSIVGIIIFLILFFAVALPHISPPQPTFQLQVPKP